MVSLEIGTCSLLWLIITYFTVKVVVINIFHKLYKLKLILQSCQKVPTLGWGKECTKGVQITTTLQRAPLTLCNLNCQALWPGQPQILLKLRKDSPKTHLPNRHLQGKYFIYYSTACCTFVTKGALMLSGFNAFWVKIAVFDQIFLIFAKGLFRGKDCFNTSHP